MRAHATDMKPEVGKQVLLGTPPYSFLDTCIYAVEIPDIERVQALTFRVRRCVVIATKPEHRLQIHPIVHN